MCFKGGSDKSSREMVQMQKEEAAAARKKEEERQARINTGLDKIKQAFHGQATYKNTPQTYDWKTFANDAQLNEVAAQPGAAAMNQVSGLPSGYSYVHVADPTWKAPAAGAAPAAPSPTVSTPTGSVYNPSVGGGGHYGYTNIGAGGGGVGHGGGGGGTTGLVAGANTTGHGGGGYQSSFTPVQTSSISPNGGGGYANAPVTPVGGGGAAATAPLVWAIQGPDGKIYYQGDALNYNSQTETGRTGGFDDAFYNKYRQGILDYYMPQVAKQYGEAKDETTYRLARAGTLKSSAATDAQKDLVDQNLKQQEKVRSNADTATADLKTRVAGEEQKAISQLYATENPDVAANISTAAVKNITPDSYEKSNLSDLFDVATIGAAGLAQGYQNQKYRNQILQPGTQKSTTVTG